MEIIVETGLVRCCHFLTAELWTVERDVEMDHLFD